MSILLAGDWHGNTTAMRRALSIAERDGHSEVIQLGDFGFGWKQVQRDGVDIDKMISACATAVDAFGIPLSWLDGNHENFDMLEATGAFDADEPKELAPGVTYLPRGCVIERMGLRILCLGGAHSVDKKYRIPHSSWWPQEEITYAQAMRAVEAGPVDVVLSHDTPNLAFRAALALATDDGRIDRLTERGKRELEHLVWKNDQQFPEAKFNRLTLQAVLDQLDPKPRRWFHGHYHASFEVQVGITAVTGLSLESAPGALAVLHP